VRREITGEVEPGLRRIGELRLALRDVYARDACGGEETQTIDADLDRAHACGIEGPSADVNARSDDGFGGRCIDAADRVELRPRRALGLGDALRLDRRDRRTFGMPRLPQRVELGAGEERRDTDDDREDTKRARAILPRRARGIAHRDAHAVCMYIATIPEDVFVRVIIDACPNDLSMRTSWPSRWKSRAIQTASRWTNEPRNDASAVETARNARSVAALRLVHPVGWAAHADHLDRFVTGEIPSHLAVGKVGLPVHETGGWIGECGGDIDDVESIVSRAVAKVRNSCERANQDQGCDTISTSE